MVISQLGQLLVGSLRLPIRTADHIGQIAVAMPEETSRLLQSGKVVVFANHPSFIETFVLWHLLDKLFTNHVWTVTDEHLFPKSWVKPLKCITVSRAKTRQGPHASVYAQQVNTRAAQQFDRVVNQPGIVVCYPEGARTCNTTRRIQLGSRQVGICQCSLLRRARTQGATLVPVWVDHGDCSSPQGFLYGYWKLLVRQPITLTFGEPYDGPVNPTGIANALLGCGQ